MVNQVALEEYSDSVRRLRKQWLDAGMPEEEFRKLYFETLQSTDRPHTMRGLICSRLNSYAIVGLIVLLLISLLFNYKTLYSCTACNLQEYIYPGLRFLRKLSIPFISLFPSLTGKLLQSAETNIYLGYI